MAYKIFSKKAKRAFKSGFFRFARGSKLIPALPLNKQIKSPFHFARGSKGQVILEYVLLLIVSVVMAQLLIAMVKLDPNAPCEPLNIEGCFSNYWKTLLDVVGADIST